MVPLHLSTLGAMPKLSFWTSKHVMHILLCERNQMQKNCILDSRLLPSFPIRQIGLKFLLPKRLPFPFYLLREEIQKPRRRWWFCLGQMEKPLIPLPVLPYLLKAHLEPSSILKLTWWRKYILCLLRPGGRQGCLSWSFVLNISHFMCMIHLWLEGTWHLLQMPWFKLWHILSSEGGKSQRFIYQNFHRFHFYGIEG